MVKFQQKYVKSHRKVPPTPSDLPCDLSWLPAFRWDWRLLLLTFVPAACFPGSCRKAYPKAFWHRGAPCSPRASRKFGLIYQGSQWILSCWIRARSRHSGSGTTSRGGLPCREPAGFSRCGGPRLGDFLAAINLLGEHDFSDEKLRDSLGIRPQKLTP